jgi:hypothetical protein
MQQFIPFEDDWAMAEALCGHRLIPYQPGMRCAHQGDAATSPAVGADRREEQNLFAPSSQPPRSAL